MPLLLILAQSDYGTLPNQTFSGAAIADAGISFFGPILIMGLIVVAAFLFFTREITRLIPIALGALVVLGLLFNPALLRNMSQAAADLLPGTATTTTAGG